MFAGLAERLLPVPFARSIGAAVFVLTAVLPQRALWSWVVPWTTTPEAFLLIACLLAAMRFIERRHPRDAFVAALAGVATAGFRPGDAAVVAGVSAFAMAWALASHWPGRKPASRILLAALAGAGLPTALFIGAHLATWGVRPSGYMQLSGAFGFEWRLLPLRWVTLMIDPQPLFPEGDGLAAVFWWIVPGFAGMAACLLITRGDIRRLHLLLIAATLLDCALFLAYRDLHPTGLWAFGNFHYFKWMLPIFGLYAVALALQAVRRPWPTLAAAGVLPALFMWRVELADLHDLPPLDSVRDVSLPPGLSHIDDVVLARAAGSGPGFYGGGSHLRAGVEDFESATGFKMFLFADTMMLTPLRPLPAVPSTLHIVPSALLDMTATPILARQRLVWGIPCWIRSERPACRTRFPFAAPALALTEMIPFGSSPASTGADRYLVAGWSSVEPDGRWTQADRAILRFAVPAVQPGQVLALEISANGYAAPGTARPLHGTATVNDAAPSAWTLPPGVTSTLRFPLPPQAIATGGAVRLDLDFADPVQPFRTGGGSDTRRLGLYIRSIRLVATSPS